MKVTVKNFQKKIHINPPGIRKIIRKVLAGERAQNSGEITVCFIDDRLMQILNKKFHSSNTPTDVLAFEITRTNRTLIADIVVSTDTACRNAKKYKTTASRETMLYVAHGLLHLLGYRDHYKKDALIMRLKENKYGYS